MTVLLLLSSSAFAFAPIPKESARILKVTRGKPFSSGAVFVNGKYLAPPYVVERWGTGIRINKEQVTGQVVDWNEFIKAQLNHKVVKQEIAEAVLPVAPEPPPPPAPAVAEKADADALDDLFDDDAKSKNPVAVRKPAEVLKPVVAKAKPTVGYALDGEFVANDATKEMVDRINALRTEIDRSLRAGGFICFGDSYSQVAGDSRTLSDFLTKVSECQKNAQSEQDFCSRIGRAGLVYLHEELRRDLYRNRVDYRRLQERRAKMKRDVELQRMLDEASQPLF